MQETKDILTEEYISCGDGNGAFNSNVLRRALHCQTSSAECTMESPLFTNNTGVSREVRFVAGAGQHYALTQRTYRLDLHSDLLQLETTTEKTSRMYQEDVERRSHFPR